MHRSIWAGDHDGEILRLSTTFPAALDSQPLQMQRRIGEMFTPLLTAMQQRDTEAQRLQTSAEKQEAIEKQRAEELKAESKDCATTRLVLTPDGLNRRASGHTIGTN